jgi:hypothetical protein
VSYLTWLENKRPIIVQAERGKADLIQALAARGIRFSVASTLAQAHAWADDESGVCRACAEGRGSWMCPECQELILLGQLVCSVGLGRV